MKRMYPALTLFLGFISLFFPAIGGSQEVLFPGQAFQTGTNLFQFVSFGFQSVAIGDVDGDGKPDLVTVNVGTYNSVTGNDDNPSVRRLAQQRQRHVCGKGRLRGGKRPPLRCHRRFQRRWQARPRDRPTTIAVP